MTPRKLGPFLVNPIGLGCMNICHAYGPALPKAQAAALLHEALDAGVNHLDTAALYGFGLSESIIGEVLASRRSEYVLASKWGMTGVPNEQGVKVRVIDGRPETLKRTCEEALQRLNTDVIDLYYLHRWDKQVPIEDSVGALADLQREGKIKAIGLSEVSSATLRRAHAVAPIAAVQTEYSLWTRNPELGVLQACEALGIALVAFSPVGRGFLTSSPPDRAQFDAKDIRRAMPRFGEGVYERNLQRLPALAQVADDVGCTPAQLAIAWLLHTSPTVVPIPGTTQAAHLHENLGAAHVRLTPAHMRALDAVMHDRLIEGKRYNEQGCQEVDTEST